MWCQVETGDAGAEAIRHEAAPPAASTPRAKTVALGARRATLDAPDLGLFSSLIPVESMFTFVMAEIA
jgi:hypothetical protein